MTLMRMIAAATFAVGLLPGYTVLGIWRRCCWWCLKLVQGFSTSSGCSGATTFVCEHAPDRRRDFYVSFLDISSYVGFAVGGLVVSILQLVLGQEQMEAWGWRLTFLVAGPLGVVAMYFRMKIRNRPRSRPPWRPGPWRPRTRRRGRSSVRWAPLRDPEGALAADLWP